MSVLLTSSDYIKAHSSLNDNTYNKMVDWFNSYLD